MNWSLVKLNVQWNSWPIIGLVESKFRPNFDRIIWYYLALLLEKFALKIWKYLVVIYELLLTKLLVSFHQNLVSNIWLAKLIDGGSATDSEYCSPHQSSTSPYLCYVMESVLNVVQFLVQKRQRLATNIKCINILFLISLVLTIDM